jgi:hypothetical protein
MPGTWTTTRVSPWAIHTFTEPEDGWLVNSHNFNFDAFRLGLDPYDELSTARRPSATARPPGTEFQPPHQGGMVRTHKSPS